MPAGTRRVSSLLQRWFRCLPLVISLLASTAHAAPAPAPPAEAEKIDEKAADDPLAGAATDSPRAALAEFRRLCREGDYASAAHYLDLAKVDANEGPRLAERLKEVLNQRLWLDLRKVSPESKGNPADNQPPDREQLGTIRGSSGNPEPIVLVRKSYRPGSHWVFSAETVAQIDGFYAHLDNRWLTEHLPKPLLQMGPRVLRWWQWMALLPMVVAALAIAHLVVRLGRAVIRQLLSERHAANAHQLRGPLVLALTVGITYASLPLLSLYQPAEHFLESWLSALIVVAIFWALWRGIELSRRTFSELSWARESLSAHSLLALGTRLAKFAVVAAAFVMVLSQLGYSATTLLTGLGIGGVAVALAAQKTVENLFGTFSLAIDQPFREGDAIKVDGVEGIVEAVGLRSTRIRTPDRTIVSIPNGKLADMRIETLNRQDKLRFFCALGLQHTSVGRLESILSEIRAALNEEPLVEKTSISARLAAVSDASMNIEATAMFATVDGARFADAKERLLKSIWGVVDASGVKLSHPIRRVELVREASSREQSDDARAEPESVRRVSQTG
jgi:MscS family membrane protein